MSGKQGEWWRLGVNGGEMHEPLTWTRCHSCGVSQLYEAWGLAYNLRGIKEKIYFLFFSFVSLFYSSFQGMIRADPAVVGGGNV